MAPHAAHPRVSGDPGFSVVSTDTHEETQARQKGARKIDHQAHQGHEDLGVLGVLGGSNLADCASRSEPVRAGMIGENGSQPA